MLLNEKPIPQLFTNLIKSSNIIDIVILICLISVKSFLSIFLLKKEQQHTTSIKQITNSEKSRLTACVVVFNVFLKCVFCFSNPAWKPGFQYIKSRNTAKRRDLPQKVEGYRKKFCPKVEKVWLIFSTSFLLCL